MNLIKVISNEEQIGGLEIEDGALRFALLKKNHNNLEIITLVEEKLQEKEGLLNGALFADKLSKFAKKNNIKYVVISAPSEDIFIKTYTFPAAMPDNKITESMDLAIELQLPKKKEEIYCDWMKIEENETDKKILLSYILKTRADLLLSIVKKVGLKVVAIESRVMSLARIIKQKKDEAILVIEKNKNNSSFAVIINNHPIFLQSIPNDKLGNDLAKESRKILNYYGWFNIDLKNIVLIGDFAEQKINKLPLKIPEIETTKKINGLLKDTKWLIPTGAALRGLIPRKEDEIISLMNIGTEKAYKREKINSTINFLIGLNTGLAIFFFAAFISTWSLITIIQNNYAEQISSFNSLPASDNVNSLKEKAVIFNNLIDQTSLLAKKEPRWSLIVTEIKNKVVNGISVNNISLSNIDGSLAITGVASNRDSINALKSSFETSDLFSEIVIPLDNLGKKVEIPFSITFKIKNTELIYNK
jgi:hypothetical protein